MALKRCFERNEPKENIILISLSYNVSDPTSKINEKNIKTAVNNKRQLAKWWLIKEAKSINDGELPANY